LPEGAARFFIWGLQVKRLILLSIAVVLLFGLADDGCLGKVKCVGPHNTAKTSVASSNPASGKIHSPVALLPENGPDVHREFTGQPVAVADVPFFRNKDSHLFSSSGGIPL
jgi:hypothetical protein